MADPFPNYDVLAKRDTLSWNDPTRRAVDERLALTEREDVLDERSRGVLGALVDRIVPQPEGRPLVNAAALLLDRIARDDGSGFRPAGLPRLAQAWERGLDRVDAEARAVHERGFADLVGEAANGVLRAVEAGEVRADWGDLDPRTFWKWRLIPDIVSAYYAHPSAWSAMGFGGPASPRGYVRLDANRRDPWEASEAGEAHPLSLPARILNRLVG